MKRFILTSVVLAFAAVIGFTPNLEAAPRHAAVRAPARANYAAHGHAVNHGYVGPAYHGHFDHFHVRGFRGWNWRCWFPAYGAYGYYSGADQLWYYWYAPFDQYLPITYMSMYPPTPAGAAPVSMLPAPAPMLPALPPGAAFVPGPITAP